MISKDLAFVICLQVCVAFLTVVIFVELALDLVHEL